MTNMSDNRRRLQCNDDPSLLCRLCDKCKEWVLDEEIRATPKLEELGIQYMCEYCLLEEQIDAERSPNSL